MFLNHKKKSNCSLTIIYAGNLSCSKVDAYIKGKNDLISIYMILFPPGPRMGSED